MNEPEERPEQGGARPGILPALLIAWGVLYLCVALGMWWYACRLPPDPLLALRIHAFLLGSLALLFLLGMSGARAEASAPAEPEAWLCQHCLKPYVPGAHFCPRCSAPKTFYSGTAGYERVYAQAWILGKAAHHPSRPMHVVALAIICLGEVLGLAASFWLYLRARHTDWPWFWIEAGGLLLWIAQAYIFCALLVLGWRSWRRRARGEDPLRPEIEYGAPPWFSYDTEWALPEYEVEPDGAEGDATPEAG